MCKQPICRCAGTMPSVSYTIIVVCNRGIFATGYRVAAYFINRSLSAANKTAGIACAAIGYCIADGNSIGGQAACATVGSAIGR